MKLLTLVAVAGVEPAHLQSMPTKDMAAGIHHSRQTILRLWGRLWNTQCRRSCIVCPLYLRRSQRSEGLGGRFVVFVVSLCIFSACLCLIGLHP